ncbi:MAG: hypothetical protein ACQCN3_00750 [Candidatus Bathyarchaeia archaeon]|jgi:methyl-accepting chemotaxis protein
MANITHQTPSAYWNRHGDWYKGAFKDVVHAFALSEETRYYATMEKECIEINAWFAADFLGILSWLKNFLIDTKRKAYQNGYVDIYDQAALSGCKVMENFEGQINAAYGKIQTTYNEAVNKAQSMVTGVNDYIDKNISPAVSNAQAQAQKVTDYLNNTINPAVANAQSKVKSMTDQLNAQVSKINQIVQDLNSKAQQIGNLDGQVNDIIAKANATVGKVNQLIPTLNTHGNQIADLYNKIGQKVTPVQNSPVGDSFSPIDKIKELFK